MVGQCSEKPHVATLHSIYVLTRHKGKRQSGQGQAARRSLPAPIYAIKQKNSRRKQFEAGIKDTFAFYLYLCFLNIPYNTQQDMKIALIGYGKMGKLVKETAERRGHDISCIIDENNTDDMTSEAFRQSDVAIEFTTPDAAYANIMQAFKAGVKVVSGTTGWFDTHQEEIETLCRNGNTLFWSSNFSIGVAIFSAVNRYLAGIMDGYPQYDVAMTETHHIHKLDAPSGTAIKLAQDILARLHRKTEWVKADGNAATTSTQLPIASIREGEVSGIHTIRYESDADIITITHEAKNRKGFALGAVLAAEYAHTHNGLLNMNDLFKL